MFLSETSEGIQPPGTPSQLDFFIHSLDFFDILGDVLEAFYLSTEKEAAQTMEGLKKKHLAQQQFTATLGLSSRLDEFLDCLPQHLKPGTSPATSKCLTREIFQLQAQTLHLRALYLRILLLRPYLLARVRPRSNRDAEMGSGFTSRLDRMAEEELSRLCLSSAHSIIEHLHSHIQGPSRTPSWHAVYCTTPSRCTPSLFCSL